MRVSGQICPRLGNSLCKVLGWRVASVGGTLEGVSKECCGEWGCRL